MSRQIPSNLTLPRTSMATTQTSIMNSTTAEVTTDPADDGLKPEYIIIIGASTGGIVLIVVLTVLIWYCCRRKARRSEESSRRYVNAPDIKIQASERVQGTPVDAGSRSMKNSDSDSKTISAVYTLPIKCGQNGKNFLPIESSNGYVNSNVAKIATPTPERADHRNRKKKEKREKTEEPDPCYSDDNAKNSTPKGKKEKKTAGMKKKTTSNELPSYYNINDKPPLGIAPSVLLHKEENEKKKRKRKNKKNVPNDQMPNYYNIDDNPQRSLPGHDYVNDTLRDSDATASGTGSSDSNVDTSKTPGLNNYVNKDVVYSVPNTPTAKGKRKPPVPEAPSPSDPYKLLIGKAGKPV